MKLKSNISPRRGEKKHSDVVFGKTVYPVANDGTLIVDNEDHAQFLIDTGNFLPEQPTKNPETMIVRNGDVEIDLMQFDKEALLTFAKDELALDIDKRTGEKKIRELIMAAVTAE